MKAKFSSSTGAPPSFVWGVCFGGTSLSATAASTSVPAGSGKADELAEEAEQEALCGLPLLAVVVLVSTVLSEADTLSGFRFARRDILSPVSPSWANSMAICSIFELLRVRWIVEYGI